MSNHVVSAFGKILLGDKIASRFLLAVVASVSFSIAIILSTIGLMDGFQDSLYSGLRASLGDVTLTHRGGLFDYTPEIDEVLRESSLTAFASSYQLEGFLLSENGERGVRVLGVRPEGYQQVTGVSLAIKGSEVAVGRDIATSFKLKAGDEIQLVFVSSNSRGDILPSSYPFIVKEIVDHKVFEKDARMIYVNRKYLEHIGLSYKDNIIFGSFSQGHLSHEDLLLKERELIKQVGENFKTRLYGGEYQSLLQAVELEKVSITIILQIIVLVAVFNIAAFITFISEKRAKDFFLLRALGIPFKKICFYWASFIGLIWVVSCLIACGLTWIFDFLLTNLSLFKLPGNIYVLSELKIVLSVNEYIGVYIAAAGWVFLVAAVALFRMSRKSLLGGLREEFN